MVTSARAPGRKRGRGLAAERHADPAITWLRLPGRPFEPQQRQRRGTGRPHAACADICAAKGWRRIDHGRNALRLQDSPQALDAPPKPPRRTSPCRQQRVLGHARQRGDDGKSPPSSSPAASSRASPRAAQDEDALSRHGAMISPWRDTMMMSGATGASLQQRPRTVASAPARHAVGQIESRRHLQHLLGRVGGQHRCARQFGHEVGQPVEVHLAAAGMQVERALRQLGDLAEAAADGHPRHRDASRRYLSSPPAKSPMSSMASSGRP